MGPNTSGLGQIFQYMLRTDDKQKFNTMELRSLNDWVVKLLLMPIDGVPSQHRVLLIALLHD
jgi:cobalt-zinc-cadmium resistance protein CzcA